MYMPKGVVTLSYPRAGNEAVMGKDFFKIPERSNDLWLAVNTKSIALSGPYHLIQGGLGLVARNPIFLTSRGGQETFWGFAAVVLDLPNALEAVGLGQLSGKRL
jgi:sensor domain CHASE-containing protein